MAPNSVDASERKQKKKNKFNHYDRPTRVYMGNSTPTASQS